MSKLLIGVLTYNDLPYLRQSMPAVEKLRLLGSAEVAVIDTANNREVREFFEKEYPEFHFFRHPEGNIGYGRANNEILKKFPSGEYYMCVTSDVLIDPIQVLQILEKMNADRSITMAAGKLYHWDFEENKTSDYIDSLGIVAKKNHHFYDRGFGEEDKGQYDEKLDEFFGISGAVFLIRRKVIEKLHGSHELFDSRMWMYKEDIDLAYRLRWLQEKIVIFPSVWGWHARTAGKGSKKAHYVILNSYKNHILLLKNNFSAGFGFLVFMRVFFYEFAKALYMLVLHPTVFFAGLATWFKKGKSSLRIASPKEMLKHFK
jgi:GT2 family glycosyltransferase